MLHRQLQILGFIAMVMAHLSAAAYFDCDDRMGYIKCTVSLHAGDDFICSSEDYSVTCTEDEQYCAEVQRIPDDNSRWKFGVLTHGSVFCNDECTPSQFCDPVSYHCYNICQKDAC